MTFYSVIFPFRSTFSIKYFQQAHGLSLEAASTLNSYVFLAAVFATPACSDCWWIGSGRHALLLTVGSLALPLSFVFLARRGTGRLWGSTVLLGVGFSLVPAVLWPAVARYVEPQQLGTAYGLMTMLQKAGVMVANIVAGYVNDSSGASAANPAGYDAMLWFFGVLSLAAFVFAHAAVAARQARPVRLSTAAERQVPHAVSQALAALLEARGRAFVGARHPVAGGREVFEQTRWRRITSSICSAYSSQSVARRNTPPACRRDAISSTNGGWISRRL